MRLSRHAKNEMRLYKITAADVESVVAAPRSTGRDEKGNPRLGGLDANDRVVVVADDDPDFVITTFPDD